MNTHYVYSSTQVDLPLMLASEIIRWGEECVLDNDLYMDPNDLTLGRADEPHATLLYGIHSDHPEEIRKLLTGVESFEIELGKVSSFTWSEKFDVLKIEAISDELHRLNKLLSRIPCTQLFPIYRPHVTVAYIKKGHCNKLLGSMDFAGRTWVADTIMFSSRGGVKTAMPLKLKSY